MDVIALDYFVSKKFIDASNFAGRVHSNAFAWAFSYLLITDLLSILYSNRGEEMDFACFLICLREAAKLVKFFVISSISSLVLLC